MKHTKPQSPLPKTRTRAIAERQKWPSSSRGASLSPPTFQFKSNEGALTSSVWKPAFSGYDQSSLHTNVDGGKYLMWIWYKFESLLDNASKSEEKRISVLQTRIGRTMRDFNLKSGKAEGMEVERLSSKAKFALSQFDSVIKSTYLIISEPIIKKKNQELDRKRMLRNKVRKIIHSVARGFKRVELHAQKEKSYSAHLKIIEGDTQLNMLDKLKLREFTNGVHSIVEKSSQGAAVANAAFNMEGIKTTRDYEGTKQIQMFKDLADGLKPITGKVDAIVSQTDNLFKIMEVPKGNEFQKIASTKSGVLAGLDAIKTASGIFDKIPLGGYFDGLAKGAKAAFKKIRKIAHLFREVDEVGFNEISRLDGWMNKQGTEAPIIPQNDVRLFPGGQAVFDVMWEINRGVRYGPGKKKLPPVVRQFFISKKSHFKTIPTSYKFTTSNLESWLNDNFSLAWIALYGNIKAPRR